MQSTDADMPQPSSTTPTRLAAVLVASEQPADLAEFYRQTLDLGAPSYVTDDHVGFALGDAYVGFERGAQAQAGGAITLWFHVDDLNATTARMVAAGASDPSEPFETAENEMGLTITDPAGNPIGLLCAVG